MFTTTLDVYEYMIKLHLRALLTRQHDTYKALCKLAWKFHILFGQLTAESSDTF